MEGILIKASFEKNQSTVMPVSASIFLFFLLLAFTNIVQILLITELSPQKTIRLMISTEK